MTINETQVVGEGKEAFVLVPGGRVDGAASTFIHVRHIDYETFANETKRVPEPVKETHTGGRKTRGDRSAQA